MSLPANVVIGAIVLFPIHTGTGVIVLLDSVPPRTLGSEFLGLKLDNAFIPRSAKIASTSR